jgi:hypothetical protein
VSTLALRCLGYTCTVEADAALLGRVESLYAPCLTSEPTAHEIVLESAAGLVTLVVDGDVAVRNVSAALALARLVWEINQGVIADPGDRLLVHASAVERSGAVALLPGGPGAGKSTLAAALVRAGLRYVTDETVGITAAGRVDPYPKPISLERGSIDVLTDLARDSASVFVSEAGTWLVAPLAIRPDAVAPPGGTPTLVLVPRYTPDAATAVRPLSRAGACVALAEHAFNFATVPGALRLVADVVRHCRCFELQVNELAGVCELIVGLLDDHAAVRA